MKQFSDNLLAMEHRIGGPSFRWKMAHRLAASQRPARSTQTDEQIQQAYSYLRTCRKVGRDWANRKHPRLAAACSLTENDQTFRTLKLSALGHVPRSEIATRLGADEQIIDVAESLFFDISGLNQASSWMNCHIFVPEAKFGSKALSAKMKLAHYGGPVVTRALLDGQEKLPLAEAQQIIDQELQLHAKLQVALEYDLDAQSAEQFLKVFLAYDLERKKLEFEREKFQSECASARERRVDVEANPEAGASNDAPRSQMEFPTDDQAPNSGLCPGDGEQLVA